MTSPQPINLLFTSVGRRVELLRAFKQAYQDLNLPGKIIAIDIDPLAPALQIADEYYLVPRLNNSEYTPTLVDICKQEQVCRIFPLIDPDIPKLAQHRDEIEATGARLSVVPLASAERTNDKWETYQFFSSLDLPTPRSWLPEHLPTAHLPNFPLFIKPRDGSASSNTYRVNNQKELDFFLDYVPSPIIQEYLPGPEVTNDVICDVDGEVFAIVSRQRIEVRGGEVSKGKTIHNPIILEGAKKIAEALPAIGPITVQCMMKDNVPHFTEINARLGGGAPLAIKAGANFPKWLLAKIADINIDIPPIGTYHHPLYLTRFDNAFYISEEQREQLASRCI